MQTRRLSNKRITKCFENYKIGESNENTQIGESNKNTQLIDTILYYIAGFWGVLTLVKALKPQAEEAENVSFETIAEETTVHVGDTLVDPFDSIMQTDVTLDKFFERPIKIAEYDWSTSIALGATFNPWDLYFSNARVVNRISNFNLLRSKLHVKFVLNGTPFHYGRLLASYNPLHNEDNMTLTRPLFTIDAVAATQRPHVFLDPMNGTGAEMCLPFFWHKSAALITNNDMEDLGEISMIQLNDLKTANGGTSLITVSVFAWAENVELAVPTQTNPQALIPQSDEYGVGPISRIAGAIARYAGYAMQIPVIGPYATATRIGAEAVGKVATLFGYSSPPMLITAKFRPETKASMANTNVDSDVNRLTVDAKQELTIDPRIVGLEPIDELAILNVAQHETYVTSFDWRKSSVEESLLFSTRVDPGLHNRLNNEIHLSAPAFAVQPFEYWRGDMLFRFQIVCSNFHKGRLKLVYDPHSGQDNAEYNTAYTTIVDISDETDVTMKIGWGESLAWRKHLTAGDSVDNMFSTTALGRANEIANGVLSVYVVNRLAVPDDTVDNDIEINMFISVGDNFEVAAPTSRIVSRLRLTESATPPVIERLRPQAAEANLPEATSENTHVANSSKITDGSTMVYFGESISSFRQLLKRYNYAYNIPEVNPDERTLLTTQPAYPIYPGYTTTNPLQGRIYGLAGGNYVYGHTTLMQYLTSAFCARRGGIRYLVDGSNLVYNTMILSRLSNRTGLAAAVTSATLQDADTELGQFVNTFNFADATGMDGITIQSKSVNPTSSVEIPYYNSNKFEFGKNRPDASNSKTSESWFNLQAKGGNAEKNDLHGHIDMYVSGGEDFTLMFYLGPPIFYFEGTPPFG